MHKIILLLILLTTLPCLAAKPSDGLTCPTPDEATTAGTVIVNEFSYHGDNANNDWIELYVNDGPQDLTGWSIILKGSGSIDETITLNSLTIPWNNTSAGRFVVFASTASDSSIQAGITSGVLVENSNLFIQPQISLHNTKQEILLLDASGNLVYYIANGQVNNPKFEYDCVSQYPDYADEIRQNGNEDQACTAADGVSNGGVAGDWEAGCNGQTTPGHSNNPASLLDHYQIEHNATGDTSTAETIVIKACASADCSVLLSEAQTADIVLTSGTGSFSDITLTFSNGQATSRLNVTTAQTVLLALQNSSLNGPYSCLDNLGGSSCNITFTTTSENSSQCLAVFPDGASTHSANGAIFFGFNSQVIGSDDNILATTSIGKNAGSNINTCITTDCVATGTPSELASSLSFQTTASTEDISLGYQGSVVVGSGSYPGNEFDDINSGSASEASITFSNTHNEYFVDRLVMGFANTLYLQAGSTYWFNQLSLGSQADIVVQGSGTALVYVNQSLSFPSPGLINSPSNNSSGDASKLVMYALSSVTFNNNSTFTGHLYVEGDLTLGSSSYAFGAISAANIELGTESTITYQSDEIAETDFGGICSSDGSEIAFYEFNQGSGQSALDSSTENRHATLGSSAAVDSQDPSWQCETSGFSMGFDSTQNQRIISEAFLPPAIGAVAFWMKIPNVPTSLNRIFGFGDGYEIRFETNGILYLDVNKTGSNSSIRTSAPITEINSWIHIAIVSNSKTGDWAVYKNAVLDNSGNETLTAQPANKLTVGGSTWKPNNQSFNGSLEDFRIYSGTPDSADITSWAATPPQDCNILDHYRIEHDTQGFTCEAESITIKACANEDCSTPYIEPVSITLSPPGWDGGETITFENDQGAIATTLAVTEEGTVTFGKVAAIPDSPLRCFNGGAETCDITFSNDGFEIFGANIGDPLPDQLAASDFLNANLRAVRSVDNVCEALLEGSQEITLSYNCDSPNQCITPLNGINIVGDGTGENSGKIDVVFNDQGVASLALLNYPDAGRLSLKVEAVVDGVNFNNSDLEPVDIYPSYLALSVEETELIYGGTGNQNNYVAGENFTFEIAAYGINDQILPNYQAENPQLKVTRIAPSSAGENGSFKYSDSGTKLVSTNAVFSNTAGLSFIDGKHRFSSANYSEVGRIEIDVQDANYLGNEITVDSVLTLGDFYPAYFQVALTETPTLANTCNNTFSYIGQGIVFETSPAFTLNAYNALGTKTFNYSDTYWNYLPDKSNLEGSLSFLDSSTYTKDDSASVINLGDAPVISSNNNYDGSGTVTINNASFRYNKVDPDDNLVFAPVSPFDAKINLVFASNFFSSIFIDQNGNEDTICYQTSHTDNTCLGWDIDEVSGTQMRYGRLVLENTYGPESESLNVPIKAQYFKAGQWLRNTEDSNCTSIDFTQENDQIELSDTSFANSFNSVISAGVLIEGVAVGNQFTLDAPNTSGELNIWLVPEVGIQNWSNYLNYDWDGDGYINTDDFPEATVSFGLFRGNDRVIHWREVFN
jgi:MSHA biogenesis protein MshQ